MEESATFFKGHFLIAMPALMDPNFRQSVTCISEHNEDGAVGIVISQMHEGLNAGLIFEELGIACNEKTASAPVHIGGPVHLNELFILHGAPLKWESSLIINDQLALSNSRDILEAIARGTGPEKYVISLGCAGWAPGQLEWELSQNAWLVGPWDSDILFDLPVEKRWEGAIKSLGIDPQLISDTPGHA